MKKSLYILLAVLTIGIMGVGCIPDEDILLNETIPTLKDWTLIGEGEVIVGWDMIPVPYGQAENCAYWSVGKSKIYFIRPSSSYMCDEAYIPIKSDNRYQKVRIINLSSSTVDHTRYKLYKHEIVKGLFNNKEIYLLIREG